MKTRALPLAAAIALAASAPALAQSPAIHDPAKVEAGTYKVDPAHTQVMFSVSHMGFSTYTGTLNDELKSAQWLDAGQFPDMTFTSTKVKPTGKGKAKVTGDLTIHGVTKPTTLEVSFVGAGANPLDKKYTVGFEAHGEIKRSDFGVKTYVPLIGDTLHLQIAGAFEQQ